MDKYEDELHDIDRDAAYARGCILHKTVELEMIINLYLAMHFAKGQSDRTWEMVHTIFGTNRITFESKIEIFREIAQVHDADFVTKNPSFLSDLKKIIENRNIFAHLHMDLQKESMEKLHEQVSFLKFKKNDFHIISISYDTIKELLKKINWYVVEIGSILHG